VPPHFFQAENTNASQNLYFYLWLAENIKFRQIYISNDNNHSHSNYAIIATKEVIADSNV
jgi:cbb3-type cytochrome oxidase cytochrome c subunit